MVIAIEGIEKRFGKHEVLKGFDLEFYEGMIYSVLGPNGSGKTTLMKAILGLVKPDDGHIVVCGEDIAKTESYRKQLGYVPQIARFPENLTVDEVIHLVQKVRGEIANPQPFIELFEIESFLHQRLKHLSGGTRQKVNLVLALMFQSKVLILDEPTSGLDPVNRLRLKQLLLQLRDQGSTIILTTHILHLAEEVSDEIVFLLDGKIKYKGAKEQLFHWTKKATLEQSIAAILEDQSIMNQEKKKRVYHN